MSSKELRQVERNHTAIFLRKLRKFASVEHLWREEGNIHTRYAISILIDERWETMCELVLPTYSKGNYTRPSNCEISKEEK